jgi:hypothetical protein
VTSPPAAPSRAASLAVLPFVNLGSRRDDDSFADGLAEELIHLLFAPLGRLGELDAYQWLLVLRQSHRAARGADGRGEGAAWIPR